jgi:hypothetical protein
MGDQPVADAQGCIPLPKDSIRAVDAQTRTMLLNPPVATSTGAVLESAFEPADGETISVVASINEDGAKHVDMSAEVAARRTTSSRKPPGMRGNRACCSWSRRATMAPRVNYPAGSDEEGDFPRPQAPIPIMKTRSYPQKIGCNGRNEFVRRQDAKLQETVRFSKFRNAVAGKVHPVPKERENGFDLRRQSAQPGKKPAFRTYPGSSSPFAAPLQPIF